MRHCCRYCGFRREPTEKHPCPLCYEMEIVPWEEFCPLTIGTKVEVAMPILPARMVDAADGHNFDYHPDDIERAEGVIVNITRNPAIGYVSYRIETEGHFQGHRDPTSGDLWARADECRPLGRVLPPLSPRKPVRVIIEVNQGLVSAVYASDRNVHVDVLDKDIMTDGELALAATDLRKRAAQMYEVW